jgi:hypothetical protein
MRPRSAAEECAMQTRKRLQVRVLLLGMALAALAALILFATPDARADDSVTVRRAELDGPDLRLCVERDGRFETLSVDSEDPDAPLLSEPGCGDFGQGERLGILYRESYGSASPRSVYVDGNIAVYIDGDGNVVRVPLDLGADDEPYEDEPEPDVRASEPDPCAGDRCIKRVPTRRGSSRIVLPGPRAGEIGDATRDATLGGLEQALDPVVEPAIALPLRGVSAAVGFAVGAALYVPTTLLDVLETEYGVDDSGYVDDPDEPDQCDPYDPYEYDDYDRPGPYRRHRRCH